jgi:hypothetical protein
MMHDFADNFVQAVVYMCFLALVGFIALRFVFLVIQWFFKWMVS